MRQQPPQSYLTYTYFLLPFLNQQVLRLSVKWQHGDNHQCEARLRDFISMTVEGCMPRLHTLLLRAR